MTPPSFFDRILFMWWTKSFKKGTKEVNQTIFFGQNQKSCCNTPSRDSNADINSTPESFSGQTCCSISSIKEEICEEIIREKAYFLWEEAGRPECDGTQFWIEAEKQLSK